MDDIKAYLFHLLTSELLYIKNITRSDIEPYVVFLTIKVAKINADDCKKLIKVHITTESKGGRCYDCCEF